MKVLACLVLLLAVNGCASNSGSASSSSSDEPVSTIPWNKPQRWEGGGAMGGMMNQ
jgi:hypothetical protein